MDRGQAQIVRQIGCADAAGGDELDALIGRGNGLERLDAAACLGREELDHLQPLLQRHVDLGGREHAGRDRHIVRDAPIDHLVVKTGRHHKLGARRGRLSLGDRHHRACAHQHIGARCCHELDGIGRGRSAKGDLGTGQPAGQQRLSELGRVAPRSRWQ